MSEDTPVIIEAAINGVGSKERNPNVPREPSEIVEDTFRCLDAGATIIHAHNKDFRLNGKQAAEQYLEAWRPILAERPDTLWYPTLAAGPDVHAVLEHVEIIARCHCDSRRSTRARPTSGGRTPTGFRWVASTRTATPTSA